MLPRDGFFVEEICQAGFAARFAFPVFSPRTYVSSGYQDNLGFGFMTALGVKVANPGRAVVSISGDGGFMFGVQELATAAQHGLASSPSSSTIRASATCSATRRRATAGA